MLNQEFGVHAHQPSAPTVATHRMNPASLAIVSPGAPLPPRRGVAAVTVEPSAGEVTTGGGTRTGAAATGHATMSQILVHQLVGRVHARRR